jgi:muramoyltetrapeptide carboxypeptidase
MLKPSRLKPGDRIGVIAPAGPVAPEDLKPGLRTLADYGLRVIEGAHLYDVRGYTAGDDDARLEDFHAMLVRPDVGAVFCARGGYGCLRLLPRIDLSLVRAHPKAVVGYSDVTALLWGLHAAAGLVSFHGPVVKGLHGDTMQDLERLIHWIRETGDPPRIDLGAGTRVIRGGRATGPVFGGNLSLVSRLVGTPFMPDLNGAILLLEDTREPLYRIDRMLTHLALAGVFDRLSGFLLGAFDGDHSEEDVLSLLMEHLSPLGIPVVAGLPVGHGGRNLPLPIGLPAVLDTDDMRITWLEPCFAVRSGENAQDRSPG